MPYITWKVYIDFDVDGSFATTGDDVTAYVMDMTIKNGMQNPFNLMSDEAELQMRLKNYDKRFSPEYSGGTYYGKLQPQRPVRVAAIYNGATATMYSGWVETFDPSPFRIGEHVCLVHAIGAKQFLQDTEVYLSLMQNVTADEVIEAILNQVILPPTGVVSSWRLGVPGASEISSTTYLGDPSIFGFLETGATNFAYVGDSWENGISANDALERVMRAERGRFFYTREGSAIFYNHSHYQIDITNAGTVNNSMVGGDYAYGEDFFPIVRVNCSPRLISDGNVLLWQMDSPVRVESGGTATIRARYTDTSDAQVGGMDVDTPSITVTTPTITLSSFNAGARSAEAVFVNSGAAGDVTAMDIEGIKLTQYNQMVVESTDGTIAGRNGRRVLSINADLLDSADDAKNVADYELANRKTPRGAFRHIDMQEKGSTVNAAQMFQLTMGDRIKVQETQTAHDADYFIIGEEWHVTDAMTNTLVRWTLEPASATAGWLVEVAGRGELDVTAYVGF